MEETPKDASVKPAQANTQPAGPALTPEPPKETRYNRFMRRTFRWTMGFLVVLGLGVLLSIYFFYLPQTGKLTLANQRITDLEQQAITDQDKASQEIAGLQVRVENLVALETKNQALVTERDMALLHVAILSARADVASAQLALAKNDPSKARVALTKTGETLKTLHSLLDVDQQKAAADMSARLELALQGIGINNNAAESDLGVLATDLLELETAYFTGP